MALGRWLISVDLLAEDLHPPGLIRLAGHLRPPFREVDVPNRHEETCGFRCGHRLPDVVSCSGDTSSHAAGKHLAGLLLDRLPAPHLVVGVGLAASAGIQSDPLGGWIQGDAAAAGNMDSALAVLHLQQSEERSLCPRTPLDPEELPGRQGSDRAEGQQDGRAAGHVHQKEGPPQGEEPENHFRQHGWAPFQPSLCKFGGGPNASPLALASRRGPISIPTRRYRRGPFRLRANRPSCMKGPSAWHP
mmetsp:Transcript_33777/g.63036  ORF Transcript_33777/g.63036 Transcript_33777/m.63036 type:complete len:246 (-) Transcript_33777:186-923(-)